MLRTTVRAASFEDEKEAALAYDAAVRRLKPTKAHAYVNFVEPSTADASNVGKAFAARQQQMPPPTSMLVQQHQRSLPGQLLPMMGGDAAMVGTTAVNHWPQLLGRMPFHPMQTHAPEAGMMLHSMQHQSVYDSSHDFDIASVPLNVSMPSHQGSQLVRTPGPQSMPVTTGMTPEGQFNADQQWLAMRGGMAPNGYVGTTMPVMARKDVHNPQIGPRPAQRAVLWDPSMGLMKMGPMDTRLEPLLGHVQGLIPAPNLEAILTDRQQSSGSNWSSQFSLNLGMSDMEASSTLASRGYLMPSPHGWP